MTKNLSNLAIQSESNFYSYNAEKIPAEYSQRQGRFGKIRKGIITGLAGLVLTGASILTGCADPFSIVPSEKNHAPTVSSLTVNPSSGNAPLEITSTGVATDPDKDPLNYSMVIKNATTGDIIKRTPSDSCNYKFDTPGTYDIIFTATDPSGLYSTAIKNVTVNAKSSVPTPIVDFSRIGGDIDENQTITLKLPGTDTAGHSVVYTDASVASGEVTLDKSAIGQNALMVKLGDISQDENYSVNLVYKDSTTGLTGTGNFGGKEYNKLDLEGVVQDNETHTSQQGVLNVLYTDSRGTHSQIVNTDSDGNFNIEINERADDISKVELEAGLGSYTTEVPTGSGFSAPYAGPSKSWTRVLTTEKPGPYGSVAPTLSLKDNINLKVAVVPFGNFGMNLNSEGAIKTDSAFKTFVDRCEGTSENPLLTKYGYEGNNLTVEIAGKSKEDGSTYYNKEALSNISEMVDTASNIIPGGIKKIQTRGAPLYSKTAGYEVVKPATEGTLTEYGSSVGQGYKIIGTTIVWEGNITNTTSYILNTLQPQDIKSTALKEISHGLIEPEDISEGYTSKDSVFFIENKRTSFTNADKKITKIVYEPTYQAFENINKYILKEGFTTSN